MTKALRAAVVGGGIGGMAAAIALRQAGIDVRLYEQAPALTEVGAGVTIHPPALRVLDSLGVGEQVSASGAPHSDYWMRAADGTVLNHESGAGLGLHRADLLDILARELPGQIVHLGHRLHAIDQDAHEVRLRFDNGSAASADVVVAADGIHSVVQRMIVDDPEPPRFSGAMAYRGLLDIEKVPDWPVATAQMWVGDHKILRVYPVRSGKLINFIAVVPADDTIAESWIVSGDPGALGAEFAGWAPAVSRMMGEVEDTSVWGLYDRAPLPRWSRGRVTLLGDAAHSMLPSMGQGANQAIEDAMAVATLLAQATAGEVPELLIRYQALRHGRTARFQRNSRRIMLQVLGEHDRRFPEVEDIVAVDWAYNYDVQHVARLARA